MHFWIFLSLSHWWTCVKIHISVSDGQGRMSMILIININVPLDQSKIRDSINLNLPIYVGNLRFNHSHQRFLHTKTSCHERLDKAKRIKEGWTLMKHQICWYLPYLLYYYTPPLDDALMFLPSSFPVYQLRPPDGCWRCPWAGRHRGLQKTWEKYMKKGQSSNVRDHLSILRLDDLLILVSWFFLKSCDSCDLMLLKSMPVRCLPSAWPMNFLKPRDQKDWFRTEDSTTIGALKPESEHWSRTHILTYCWVIHLHHAGLFSTKWLSNKRWVSFCSFSDFNLSWTIALALPDIFRVSSHVCQFIPSPFFALDL